MLLFNHPLTPEHVKVELVERLKPFEIISSMRERTPFPASLLSKLPNLKLLLTTGTRNAAIDLDACRKQGVRVTGTAWTGDITSNVQGKKVRGPDGTTQHTVALILSLARNLVDDCQSLRLGGWQTTCVTSLSGKTFCTLGLGKLGGNVAKIMHEGFGMRVLCWSSNLTQASADERATSLKLPIEDDDGEKTFKVVTKEELMREADVLSLHCVLSERSRGIVGASDLASMKRSALLINTSREPLVDEEALWNVLEKGMIRGVAVDVFDIEPLPWDSKWRR
jgi:lactate dehydrogenase-like 2-hydroxyacid dehydrogenase